MEKFFYEMRPFFFALSGVVAIAVRSSDPLMVVSGLILIGASAHVIRSRLKHRAWLRAT